MTEISSFSCSPFLLISSFFDSARLMILVSNSWKRPSKFSISFFTFLGLAAGGLDDFVALRDGVDAQVVQLAAHLVHLSLECLDQAAIFESFTFVSTVLSLL